MRTATATLTPAQTTVSADGYTITVIVDLSAAAAGAYDVVVTTPNTGSTMLRAGFTVGAATTPVMYFYIDGPYGARPGHPAFFNIVYGNRGTVDAFLVPLSLSLPGNFTNLILSQVVSPPNTSGAAITDWSHVPVQANPLSASGFVNVPLVIPVVPAGTQGVLRISITPPATTVHGQTFQLDASVGKPYGLSPKGAIDPAALAELMQGAQTKRKETWE